MTTIFSLFGLGLFLAGSALLSDLGSGQTPVWFQPVAKRWSPAGYNPKWITLGIGTLFGFVAALTLLYIGIPLHTAIVDLGTPND